jgi:hypothetical protein
MAMLRAENRKANPDPLARGGFTDGANEFWVYASSEVAPDSFQVCANGNRADIVLIASGLNTGAMHSTWGAEWRARPLDWRGWAKNCAFHVFENGSLLRESRAGTAQGKVRFCNG